MIFILQQCLVLRQRRHEANCPAHHLHSLVLSLRVAGDDKDPQPRHNKAVAYHSLHSSKKLSCDSHHKLELEFDMSNIEPLCFH